MHTVQSTALVDFVCPAPGCSFQQTVDGSEAFLLRKQHFTSQSLGSFELCFSWELLYEAIDLVEEGSFFFSILRQRIKAYKRAGWGALQLCGLQSLYRPLKEAIMDFVDLMDLPYHLMGCTCGRQCFIADALMLSVRREAMFASGGWLPRPTEPDEQPVPAQFGSDYQKRFVLASKELRVALRAIAQTSGGSIDQLIELQALCNSQQMHSLQVLFASERGGAAADVNDSIVEQLQNQNYTVRSWARALFMLIGSDSPALAIVSIADTVVLGRWVGAVQAALAAPDPATAAAAAEWSLEDQERVQGSLPLLWSCLQAVLGYARTQQAPAVCSAFCSLITELNEVCGELMLHLQEACTLVCKSFGTCDMQIPAIALH